MTDTPCSLRAPRALPAATTHDRRPIKLSHLETIAVALRRSPAAFLVDSDEAAAIVEQIASNQERCLHVLFFLEALAEPSEAVDGASEAQSD